MPGGFASLDTSFPNLEGQTTEQKLRAMEDYLVQLLENLRYTLHNLGVENLNVSSVKELGDIITEPIRAEIDDPDTGLSARINANADAITMEVSRATGAESLIRQSADDIKAQVTDGQGNYTVLNLKSDGLHIGNASGTSTIDGGSITAGSVTATQIAAHTITGDELHANVALSAPVITGGSVTGAEVTSKTRAPGLSYDSIVKVTDGEVAFYYGTTLYGKLGIYDAMGNLIFSTENDVALKLSAPIKIDSNSYGGTLPSGLGISDAGRLFFKI